jgi:hypothetical protein
MFASPPFTFYIQRKDGKGQGNFESFKKNIMIWILVMFKVVSQNNYINDLKRGEELQN